MNDAYRQEREAMPDVYGGLVCLDFANAVEPRGGPAPYALPPNYEGEQRDYLTSYRDLVVWGLHVGVLERGDVDAMIRLAQQESTAACAVHGRAIALRETLYRAFYAIAHGESPTPDDLTLITDEQRSALEHATLERRGDVFGWVWHEPTHLERIIWIVADSATRLLTDGDLSRIKVCPGVPGDTVPCAWLFYDESKSRTRTWCSMQDCGGTVKARRQNARRRRAS